MVDKILEGKKIFLTGGTGSLGRAFLYHVLSGEHGMPERITIYSRDEAKQFYLLSELENDINLMENCLYSQGKKIVRFVVGDVRDYINLKSAMSGHDLVIHAAALKQVPSCELFPIEAMKTNCMGAENVVRASSEINSIKKCVFISTDKAAKPTNAMGITKALQEKIFVAANSPDNSKEFVGVRYGNVIASRGSVIPTFVNLIKNGDVVPITDVRMTRFLLTLPQAVETIMCAIKYAKRGEIIVPNAQAAKIIDVVEAISGRQNYPQKVIGIRPGEKLHEIMISHEEAVQLRKIHTEPVMSQDFFAICPKLEFYKETGEYVNLDGELSSELNLLGVDDLKELLVKNGISITKNIDIPR